MKNTVIVVSIIVALSSAYAAYFFGQKADRSSKDLNEERYNRMIAEESLEKSRSKLTSLQVELTRVQTEQRSKEKMLKDQNLTASELKSQLDQIAKDRQAAEDKIKDLEAKIQNLETQTAQQAQALQEKEKAIQNNVVATPEPVTQTAVPGSS